MRTPLDPRDAKAALRRQVLAARAERSVEERRDAGSRLRDHGVASCGGSAVVAAYISVGDEPTTGPLLDALVDGGTSVVVPVVVGDRLDWAEYAGAASLRPGPFGLLQPTGPRLGAAALSSAAIVVVPALAVDAHGRRLGRGGGYYDRALVGVTASVVALVYDDELVDEVPVEPHDRRVDAVLRPSGLLRLPFDP